MLSVENSNELLSEGRGREANESAAPNVIIYQKFKLSIGNKKKRNNRFKINQSMGIKEMINYRKQSVRDSLPNKGSINNQLFSSIGSGSIIGKDLFILFASRIFNFDFIKYIRL